MRLTRLGWWLEEAGDVTALPALHGDVRCDVVVIGGGYTGMWTAWHIREAAPDARVVLLEHEICGHGPSGRNGGFVESYWRATPLLRAAFGDEPSRRLADASSETVSAIGEWCERQGVDAWFAQRGSMLVATGPRQRQRVQAIVEGAAALGAPERARFLTPAEVQARCASPAFGPAVLIPDFATVQPARLALGLRATLLRRAVDVYENTHARRVRRLPSGELRVECGGGSITARAGVVAINSAMRAWSRFSSRIAASSSHIVLTEPVPDVLEELGWTGGESITDGGRLVHYLRTTPDSRIAFGWAGGGIPMGGRLGGRVEADAAVAAQVRADLVGMFPQLAARPITHAWGGPIDVSPTNLPQIDSLGTLHVGFGFTGNGVGPSHLVGRTMASLALDRRDALTTLPIVGSRPSGVPPEPIAWAGGNAVRAALEHIDRRDVAHCRPNPLATAVAALPGLLGIRVGR